MDEPEGQTTPLPRPTFGADRSVQSVMGDRRSRRAFADEPLSTTDVATLCWAAQGVTDEENGFRAAPSAGATYPLSLAVVAGSDGVEGFDAGVYRYRPGAHSLVSVTGGDRRTDLREACLDQSWVASAPVALVLLADPTPTARRYGDRGRERYVPVEAGHAGQNLYLAAEALDLGTVLVGAFDDDAVGSVVGATAAESPLAVYPVGVPRES